MRTILAVLLTSSITLGSGCKKDSSGGLPGCLHIKFLGGGDDCITKVEEYMFQGRKVYRQVVGGGCADVPTTVVDAKCEVVCSCCGISGIPTGPTEEFAQQATFVRVVWER